ncbi:AIM24 family protein [Methanobacterium sp. ACI-7]|uniref:AIM24 family protein n=1 Tax=unclassified Methanobacterium TaxID=2627676 RepID=UPI0039C22A0F
MECPNCGENLGDDARFCPECGAKIEQLAPEANPVETQVQTEEYTSKYSVQAFLDRTAEKQEGDEIFELENDYLLDVNLNGKVWAKWGSMVAYTGDVTFKKQSSLEGGLGKFVMKKVSGESSKLMSASGQGHVYLADNGKRITILNLEGNRLFVNGNDIIAFEEQIEWDIKMMSGAGSMSGGLFNIRLEGYGMIAITTHYTPITLAVTPDRPVYTDPNATVAWSDGLSIDYKTDVNLGTLLGRGSGETFQMQFRGEGFVIVQPYEEIVGSYGQI